MAYEHLTPREAIHIQRAYSQAVYYAQRGFADAVKINLHTLPAKDRAILTGIVGEFLMAYVIGELAPVVNDAARRQAGERGLTLPMTLDDTDPATPRIASNR